MPFLQQQQQQSDGFQNLLGILKANRERDAADLARFKDNNRAISRGGRRDLIAHGVIDEGDTLEGMQDKLNADVEKAAQTKAAENPGADKSLGNGYIASKLGQKGFNEQQTFANAGADSFNERMKNAGLKFGNDGKAYRWDNEKRQYYGISDKEAQGIVDNHQTYKLDPEGKNSVDALRYAAQKQADAKTDAAVNTPLASIADLRAARKNIENFDNEFDPTKSTSAIQAAKNSADAARDGGSLGLPTVDKAAMARKDDADASRQAVDNTVKKAATDTDSVFTAANNESGNAQYNYARGKQYIESMIPAGPERDAAIGRYKEMFMQQQLVGEKGAYMGNIYEDKSKGHAGTGGSGGRVVTAKDLLGNQWSFDLKGYSTFGELYKNNRKTALETMATGLGFDSVDDLPDDIKKLPPAEWKGVYKDLFNSLGSQNQGLRFRPVFDQDTFDQTMKAGGKNVSAARKSAINSAYAKSQSRAARAGSEDDQAALGSGK